MARLGIDLEGNIKGFENSINRANSLLNNLKKNADIDIGSASGGGRMGSSNFNRGLATSALRIAGIGTAIGGTTMLLQRSVRTIADFDSGLIDIAKTTGLAGKELETLGDNILQLSKNLQVVSTNKLLEYGAVAGQLGIHGAKDIERFAESLAILETASNVSGRHGAEQVARFLQLADGGVKNVKEFSDELVHLGNNFAATESQILQNALSIAQNTGAYEIAREEMLAYAAATSAVGIQSEVVGSAMNRTLQQLNIAVAGGKNATAVFNALKLSQEDLANLIRDDASGAFKLLVSSLHEAHQSGEDLNMILRDMGIRNVRDIRVVQTLATKGYDVLADSFDKVMQSANAAGREFDVQSEKIVKQTERVGIAWDNMVQSINRGQGNLGKAWSAIAGGISNVIDAISELSIESDTAFKRMKNANPLSIGLRAWRIGNRPQTSGDALGLEDIMKNTQPLNEFLGKIKKSQDEYVESQEELRKNASLNKAFWQEQVKQLREVRDEMDVSKIGTKEWIDVTNQLADAQKNLNKYNDKAKKVELPTDLRNILDLGGNYYENKIRSIGREYEDLVKKIVNSGQSRAVISKALGLAEAERDFKELNVQVERFVDAVAKMRVSRAGLPTELSGEITIPNELPGLERASERINRAKIAGVGDEYSRMVQRQIVRGLTRGLEDVFSKIDDLGSNFYEVFSNVFESLSSSILNTLQRALLTSLGESFVEKMKKNFSIGNLSNDVSNAIVAGAGLAGQLLGSNVFKDTSTVGQGLSQGITGAASGLAIGSQIGAGLGVPGLIVGGLIGGLAGIFGASKAKKQEAEQKRIQEQQLAEQKRIAEATERANALAWDSRIIGQQTNLGLVDLVDRDVFGNIIARIDGKDIVLAYDRALNSR